MPWYRRCHYREKVGAALAVRATVTFQSAHLAGDYCAARCGHHIPASPFMLHCQQFVGLSKGTSSQWMHAFTANGYLCAVSLLQTMLTPAFSLSGPFNTFALKTKRGGGSVSEVAEQGVKCQELVRQKCSVAHHR